MKERLIGVLFLWLIVLGIFAIIYIVYKLSCKYNFDFTLTVIPTIVIYLMIFVSLIILFQ